MKKILFKLAQKFFEKQIEEKIQEREESIHNHYRSYSRQEMIQLDYLTVYDIKELRGDFSIPFHERDFKEEIVKENLVRIFKENILNFVEIEQYHTKHNNSINVSYRMFIGKRKNKKWNI